MSTPQDQVSDLARLQQWMQQVITHPDGVAAGVRSEAAQRCVEVDPRALEQVVAPSETLSGAQRLAIYWRSYHARLLLCLQSIFPGLLHALGSELFNHFALDYLRRHPPHSYTLDYLADAFPQHLAETRPDAAAPPHERERWPDFLIELASLELALVQIYDGPGLEGLPALDPDAFSGLGQEHLLSARLEPAPCLRAFQFCYPVHTYRLAVQRDQHPQLPAPAESFVALTRSSFQIRWYELSWLQHTFLQALLADQAVGVAGIHAARVCGVDQLPLATIVGWLGSWAEKGFFKGLSGATERCE
jgi:hypothetical protein